MRAAAHQGAAPGRHPSQHVGGNVDGRIDGRLLAAAAVAWLCGLAVYAFGRETTPLGTGLLAAHIGTGWLPPVLHDNLPSLAHVCACALATAALGVGARTACGTWLAADALLELAQLPDAQRWLHGAGLTWWPPGHYDVRDLAALLAGALLAWFVIRRCRRHP